MNVKKLKKKLTKKDETQLKSYYSIIDNCRLGILTNGISYKFFTNTDKLMDRTPFIEIDLNNLSTVDISELEMFTKEKYNSKNLENIVMNNKIRNQLNKEFEHPSDDFVKIIAKKVDNGVMNKNKLKKYRKIIKNNLKIISHEKLKEVSKEPIISSVNFKFKGFTKKEEEEFKTKYKGLPEKFKDDELIRNNNIVKLAKNKEAHENSIYGNDDSDFKLVDNILTKYFIKTNNYTKTFVDSGIFKKDDPNIKKKTKRRFINYLNNKELDKKEKKLLDRIFSE